jgi:PAS domain S-box-containing protein
MRDKGVKKSPPSGELSNALTRIRELEARHESLERERTVLRTLIDTIQDYIYAKDLEGRFVTANLAVARQLGFLSPEELVGKSDFDLFPRELAAQYHAAEQAILQTGEELHDYEGPTVDANKGRQERWVSTTKTLLRNPHGEIVGFVGIGRDITDQKRLASRLEEERTLLHTVIDLIPDNIYVKDRESRFLHGNTALAKLLGADAPRAVIGKTDRDYFPEEMAKKFRKDELRVMETAQGLINIEENTAQTAGSERWLLTTKVPLVDRAGAITGIVGIGRDITERKRLERKVEQESALLHTVMNNIPDHIYCKDRESRFVLANTPLALWLGAAGPEDILGRTDHDFFPRELADQFRSDELQIIDSRQSMINQEETTRSASGSIRWVLTTKIPILDNEGTVTGIVGIGRNITERRQAEEKNIRLATLVESSMDAIVGLDMDRIVTSWNKGAESVYGYSAEEALGKPSSLFMPPEFEDEALQLRGKVNQGEHIESFETQRKRKDGTLMHVSLTLSPIRNADGEIVGTASITRDITEQKALQARIMRAQRLESLGTLAGGIAHQFNNINTVVGGYLELARREKRLPARLASYVEAAYAGLQKAVAITDRLLGLTEPGGSSNALRLDVLARTLLSLHEKRIEEEKVRLVLDLAETPPVEGNEVRLRFVLSSLISNALDSLLDRPVRMLSLRTGSTKDAAYIEVEDSGCGIPEEDLPRIFSPFFSAKGEWAPPGSPQARLKGVGLSLAISGMMVSEYGGRIDVQSTKGAGSTFKVLMPLAGVKSLQAG